MSGASSSSGSNKKEGQKYGEIRNTIDLDVLNEYLKQNVQNIAAPVTAKQFSFGQSNPTYILTDSNSQKYVLRKKPPGTLLSPTAHAVEREYKVLKALGEHNDKLPGHHGNGPHDDQRLKHRDAVPVPRVYTLCEDPSVLGTPWYIMQFVEGRIFEDPRMITIPKQERKQCYESALKTLAALHRIKPADVGLETYGKAQDFYMRQLKGLGKVSYMQSKAKDKESGKEVGEIPHFKEITTWFAKNMVADENGITHGDYKIDNLIFHPTEPRVIGVLDWELSTLGHPLSDLGNILQPFSLDCSDPSSASAPLEKLQQAGSGKSEEMFMSLGGLDEGTSPVPTKEQNLKTYCHAAGRPYPIPNWAFCEAWAWFRLAVIAQGIAARVAQKQASSAEAVRYASKFPACAENVRLIIRRSEEGKSKL